MGGTITVMFDGGEALAIVTDSSRYSLDGLTTESSFAEVSMQLSSWESMRCPDGSAQVRLNESPQGPATEWRFSAGPGVQEAQLAMIATGIPEPLCFGE